MFAITGITGQVGGHLAHKLLEEGHAVRAVMRDPRKAPDWRSRGCDIALAAMTDIAALTAAFDGATAAFVLLPPCFDPAPGFPESTAVIEAVFAALDAARPGRVVALSTIGAQATEENLLTQLQRFEQRLQALTMPVSFLRPAWFCENAAWDVASARDEGVLHTYLQPADKPVPMVATRDVATVAAALLRQPEPPPRLVELEGPERIAPADTARMLGAILQRDVRVHEVPRSTWEAQFRAQGMCNPRPRMRMLDGFNEGWIEFEGAPSTVLRGATSLESVLAELTTRAAAWPQP